MPDPNAVLQVLRDPNLQTGPFPVWPTLPPVPQAPPHYLENDPTPWQGGDFPTNPTPLGILMTLLGGKGAMKGEKIVGATYRVAGKTFVAPTHVQAMDKALQELNLSHYGDLVDLNGGLEGHNAADGFLTSTGRVVGRQEAAQIAAIKTSKPGSLKAEDLSKQGYYDEK